MRGHWKFLLVAGLLVLGCVAPASAGYDDDVATCLDKKADDDAAIGACTRMIAVGKAKDLDVAYNNRGVSLAAKDDHDGAIADFTRAIRLNGRDYIHFRNRGDSWQAKDEDDRAIADYDQAIRLSPKDATTTTIAASATSKSPTTSARSPTIRAPSPLTRTIASSFAIAPTPMAPVTIRTTPRRPPTMIARSAWMRPIRRPSTAAVSLSTARAITIAPSPISTAPFV
jgi:tetratricopeptide (TPR) repeat protein